MCSKMVISQDNIEAVINFSSQKYNKTNNNLEGLFFYCNVSKSIIVGKN